jgi:hypothetical protein
VLTHKILLKEDLIFLCTSAIIHKFALNKLCGRMGTSFCYDVDPFLPFVLWLNLVGIGEGN